MTRCPTHPECPAEDCPRCERLIAEAECERDGGGGEGDWRAASDRYEKWLDEIGGSA